jgi:hypothetical protein
VNLRLKSLLSIKALALGIGFLASQTIAQTYTWKNVTVPAGGFVAGVEFSPVQSGLYYCRTDIGGVYRWDNTNSVWVPLNDMYSNTQYNYYGGESIAPDPQNANVVYEAAGMYTTSNGVILSSTNQGNTWTVNTIAVPMGGNDDGREAGERLAVDPNLTSTLYFGSRSNGLWTSTNSAASWSKVAGFPVSGDAGYGLSYVLFDPHGTTGTASATIYVGVEAMASGNSNLYRSTNAGGTWTLIPGGPTNMITPHACLGTDGNLWIVYDSGGYGPNSITTGQIWKLNTSTLAWTHVTLPNPAAGSGGYGGLSVDAENAQHVVIATLDWWGGPDHIYSTTNGGTSWSVIGNAQNSWDGGPFANYNNNGALWTRFCTTYDGGVGWQGEIKIDPFNSNNAIYTTGGGVWSSTNIGAATQPGGVTWTFTDYGLEETAVLAINASSAGGIFFSAVGDIGGMRHTDVTQSPAGGMYCNPTFTNTNCVDFEETTPNNTVVRVGNSSTTTTDVAYSTNNGQTWTPWGSAPPGYGTANEMESVAVAADGSHVVVSPFNGYGSPAYASSLGGAWTTCTGLPSGSQIASDRANATTFYATNGTNLYISTNSGSSFSVVNTFTGGGMPRAVFGVAGEVWVPAGGSGLFRFTNGGSTKTTIANVSNAIAVGFGKADAPTYTHPAVYLVGTVSGTYGFFRCDDGVGTTWTRINDANHQFGAAGYAGGDETVYGRIYVGTNGRGILYGDLVTGATNTPTNTPTVTSTTTRTNTPTLTPTVTPTTTRTVTSTTTSTNTAASTSTSTQTVTMTTTPTASRTFISTLTMTVTPTVTSTASSTITRTTTPTTTSTNTVGNTSTYSPTLTSTVTSTTTRTITPTLTPTTTATDTSSVTPSQTMTLTPTVTRTNTQTSTSTVTSTLTLTATTTLTGTATATLQFSATNTLSPTVTFTPTTTATSTQTRTATSTNSMTSTSTVTPTSTPTRTLTVTVTVTSTDTSSSTPTSQFSSTNTLSPTATMTFTATFTPTNTLSPTHTFTVTNTSTQTPTSTATNTPTMTDTSTATGTWTVTPSPTDTPVDSYTPTLTSTFTSSSTFTSTQTPTFTGIFTSTQTTTNTHTWTSTSTFTTTPTHTFTWTWTPSWTQTATPTYSPTTTPTLTLTINPTSTLTPAPTSLSGVVLIYPNPVSGPTVQILPPAYSGITSVRVEIYTLAFRKVQDKTYPPMPSGTAITLTLTGKSGNPLANGVYYVVVTVDGHRSIGKLLVLR